VYAQFSAKALNHLLTQNSWALQRLARFAGKTARFDIAPFSFAYTIMEDGSLREAAAEVSADATCIIPPTLLPRLALRNDDALKQIESSGDTALIEEIFFLARNLRWDAAEDLSRVTGDIAAERIVQAVQNTRQQLRDTMLNLSQAAAEYWTEERPLLAKPQHVSAFMQQVDSLRDDAAELEQRIARLSATQKI
jgi:ubiquinone biosynthesis protein UbiJ